MPDLRTADLLRELLGENGWLTDDSELNNLLPADARIEVAGIAERLWSSNTSAESAEVVLGVDVSLTQSGRNNRRVDKDFEVEVVVAATTEWVENKDEGSILDLQDVHDRVGQILDFNRKGWEADGISGGTEGVINDDETEGYAGVVLAGVSRSDDHAAYQ